MDREVGKGIQEVNGKVYQRTGISNTRLRQKLRMEIGVSDYTMGDILFIEYEDGSWRLVVYLSKLLNETERNYKIHDKEMLVVIRGLENWRHLLEGAKFKFKVWMDHKNLEYFMKVQKLN